jgi:hypothetical protein
MIVKVVDGPTASVNENVTILKLAATGPQGPAGTSLTSRGAWATGTQYVRG